MSEQHDLQQAKIGMGTGTGGAPADIFTKSGNTRRMTSFSKPTPKGKLSTKLLFFFPRSYLEHFGNQQN